MKNFAYLIFQAVPRKNAREWRLIVGAGCLLLFCSAYHAPASAAYKESCRVRYEKEFGWSQIYEVECTYALGSELNRATSSFNYQAFATYAVVFWAKGEASVIRMEGTWLCGFEASDGCASNGFVPARGKDERDRVWKICNRNLLTC